MSVKTTETFCQFLRPANDACISPSYSRKVVFRYPRSKSNDRAERLRDERIIRTRRHQPKYYNISDAVVRPLVQNCECV